MMMLQMILLMLLLMVLLMMLHRGPQRSKLDATISFSTPLPGSISQIRLQAPKPLPSTTLIKTIIHIVLSTPASLPKRRTRV